MTIATNYRNRLQVEEAISQLENIPCRLELTRSSMPHGGFSLPKFHELSLGKFTAPTATFCWPSLKPFSQLEEPSIERAPSTDSGLRTASSSSSCTSLGSTSEYYTMPVSESAPLKRSRSEYDEHEYDNNGNSSNGLKKTPWNIPIMGTRRTRKELFDDPVEPLGPPQIISPSRKNPIPRTVPAPRIVTDCVSSVDPRPATRTRSRQVGQCGNFQTNWEKHAEYIENNNFCCVWGDCGYQAKKQLVKRHIETTHMKLKPFACRLCNSRFPQKTSLNVHVASKHTRDNPYKCPFDGCQKAFNDPARLHRHKTDAHDYVPKLTIRCNKKPRVSPNSYAIVPYSVPSSSES